MARVHTFLAPHGALGQARVLICPVAPPNGRVEAGGVTLRVPVERIRPCRAASLEEVDDWYAAIADFEQPKEGTSRDGMQLAP